MTASLPAWDIVVSYLESVGVKHLFGLPSDDLKILKPLSKADMEFIICKDQRNAVFMASGYSLATSRLAVCVVGKGPALSNTLTGLLEAQNLSVPLLLLALGTGGDKLGTRSFQEADQMSMVKPLVKWAYRVEHGDRLQWALERAAFMAVNGAPGPVYIELPEQLVDQLSPVTEHFAPLERLSVLPGRDQLKAADALLRNARRPLILTGGGMKNGDGSKLEQLATKYGAAVFATASGRGTVDEYHPLFGGVAGLYTDVSCRVLWEEADLVIALGSRLEETATFEWESWLEQKPLIQVNMELNDLAHQYEGLKLLGDGYAVLDHWLEQPLRPADSDWVQRIADCKEAAVERRKAAMAEIAAEPGLHVPELLEMIASQCGEDLVLVQENGLQDMWSYFYPYFAFGKQAWSIVPSDQTSLGFGAAAALGAAAAGQRPVVALVGDGAFNLFRSDLITAAEYRIPALYLVLNNGGYGWLQNQLGYQSSTLNGSYPFVSGQEQLDVSSITHEFVDNRVIRSREEAAEQLAAAWDSYRQGRLVIVDVQVTLTDIHEKIRHVYGDFPLPERTAVTK
ncbi:thiamine pyrophosphate-binding protein [Paenibacillus bovis]|uniref:Thiamine pyrophosphate-binding protein n=1 Tax=Paenibacillus bovis TaxID=1616788 RepID=A0A172ZKC5_9BACL|nr:thiamine pyrophosphate-binding protein [Paenibacillus bovis]ANF97989.1 thiamine pyrophosphate-binding protein [Paenibacillus bovis]